MMYESIVVIINGKKYILNYNTELLYLSDLPKIIDFEEIDTDFEAVNEDLCAEYDSVLTDYRELIVEEEE